jgi:DNA-binding transcriptional ArsR family regulator
MSRITKSLNDKLRKNIVSWLDEHNKIIRQIKKQIKKIHYPHIANPLAPKIVETNASELGYEGILKQIKENKEQILQFIPAYYNDCQNNYSTIKK